MSPTPWIQLVEAIHTRETKLVAAVTGGGSKAISQLLDVAGASRTILEAVVPYSSAALEQWLGGAPDRYCSEPTARSMAMAAWMRARQLATEEPAEFLLGVGATASLASDRPKRGPHRVHVAVQTAALTASYSLQMSKGSRDRKKEQWLAAKLILFAVGEACQVETSAAQAALDVQLLENEQIEHSRRQAEAGWAEVLRGCQNCVVVSPRSRATTGTPPQPEVVFPGAFNPPHIGHQRMAEVAATRLGSPVAFELSITNVDKPPLDYIRIHQRLETFQKWDHSATLLLTDAPTLLTKSFLFPGCTFVVGTDTMVRIADPRYYDGDQAARDAAVQSLAEQGCRFLVFGRRIENLFQGLSDLTIPDSLQALCDEVPESEFREDVSSTELRGESKK